MSAETDDFVIATFALWAGDFEHFERLLRKFSPPGRRRIERPEDLIRETGAIRLGQLKQKRSEFKILARGYDEQIPGQPMVINSRNLRGALWRTDNREFVMRGYLSNLGAQARIFEQARELAASDKYISEPPREVRKEEDLPHLEADEAMGSPGSSWIVPGELFIQVEINDFALIEARGLWTQRALPIEASQIVRPFQEILDLLDKHPSEYFNLSPPE